MRLYLDSAYIAKCYLHEPGTDAVLDLVESSRVRYSSALARVEVESVFHRHFREGNLTRRDYRKTVDRFARERDEGLWQWLPVTDVLIQAASSAFRSLAPTVFLRSADCIHLTTAQQAGFTEVYSNDRHLLAAAVHFSLTGRNVIEER